MELEKQVCSLELAKKLKELGVKQESLFRWYVHNKGVEISYYTHEYFERSYGVKIVDSYPAFTVAELGEMLPIRIQGTNKNGYARTDHFFACYSATYRFLVGYHADPIDELCKSIADNEADARAKLLIYLLENNLTTL
jgi:hypothetical protein